MSDASLQDTAVFPLIADPSSYTANTIDMIDDVDNREYWLNVFAEHTRGLRRRAIHADGRDDAEQRADRFATAFDDRLKTLWCDPLAHGDLSIMLLCQMRQDLLAEHGFDDPYHPIKSQENDQALRLLPDLLNELDALQGEALLRRLIEDCFAGNIFDLGAASTIGLYESGNMDFHAVRDRLPDRPWCVDDFDTLAEVWSRNDHRKAVVFIDNAGADFVLGMIPLIRSLLQRSTDVVVTANSEPALNDVTYEELVPLIDRIARIDGTFADALDADQLTLVPSGNGLPVIDLSKVTGALADASKDADLLIIEGMGRALETNYHTRFTCDTLKLAMVKEQNVADHFGGKLYDVICRFEPA